MSLMINLWKKSDKEALERLESEQRSSSWSTWAGWGVAAVVVVAMGPLIVERWHIKGAINPISAWSGPATAQPNPEAVSAALGTIHALSEPAGAGVLLDGRFIGVTPLRFQWASGATTLTLKKHGFQDLVAPVQVESGQQLDVRVTLQPELLPVAAAPAAPTTAPISPAPTATASAALADPPPSAEPAILIPVSEEPESDPPLKLAGIIRHPPEVKGGNAAKEEGKTKPQKTAKTSKGASEAELLHGPIVDVRESNKDPDLTPLLRQSENTAPDSLNFSYAIQIAAFLDRDSAVRNAAYWRKRGYDAYVLELWGVKDPTRLWQSVRVGRFNDLAQARQALEALKRQEKQSGFYVARSDSFTPPEGTAPTQSAKIVPLPASENPVGNRAPTETEPTREEPQNLAAATSDAPSAPLPMPVVSPTPRKNSVKPEPKLPAAEAPKAEDLPQAATPPTRAEFEAEYPQAAKAPPPCSKESSPPPTARLEPNPDERKVVALQPSVVGVQTARDVLPEPSAWSDNEFRGSSRSNDTKPSKQTAADQSRNPTPQMAPESKALTEKRRTTPTPANSDPQGRDTAKANTDQATWIARTYQQAVEKKEAGDREGEEGLLQQIVKMDPNHKPAVRRLARIMVETNRGDRALELLRQATGNRTDPSLAEDDPNLAAFLAALYQRREEHWQAIDLYDALLKRYPNKGLWQMGMAISLEKVEENNEALRAYKKALASGDLSHKLQSFVRKRIEKL
ncbi:MAG: PEGA domain-containing protein [Magnetococcales bacterium]|nr:PEGA domain-containing protein [Magnetococcales bacterium]